MRLRAPLTTRQNAQLNDCTRLALDQGTWLLGVLRLKLVPATQVTEMKIAAVPGAKIMTREENTALRPKQIKRPYRAPDLHKYGNIQEITQTVGRAGNNDNGVGVGKDHSQPV